MRIFWDVVDSIRVRGERKRMIKCLATEDYS